MKGEKELDIDVGSEEELLDRVHTISKKCGAVFQDKNTPPQGESTDKRLAKVYVPALLVAELEGLMYCVASLFHIVPFDRTASLLDNFCKTVLSGLDKSNARHKMRM